MRVLYAEDEEDMNHIVTKKLEEEGYSVDSCLDGEEVLDYLRMTEYDVVILDVMMPEADGYQVLRRMRETGIGIPVIFLTAKDGIPDRIKGLDSGANDYLVKPFSLEELAARVRVLTRSAYQKADNLLKAGDLVMDCSAHSVERNHKKLHLSAKEYQLLEYLMMNHGIVVSREQIEDHIWNFDYEGGTNVVDVYIRYLRKKIDEGYDRKLIHTVRGSGYVLREEQE